MDKAVLNLYSGASDFTQMEGLRWWVLYKIQN